ncbi:MAG: hypothetical protein HRT35_04235 [Algicola sp.]|nr:hypothetical protein [Algicola sp.]
MKTTSNEIALKPQKQPAGLKLLRTYDGRGELFYDIAFSSDGKTVASSSTGHNIELWEIDSGESVGVLKGHTERVYFADFSPDGKKIVSSSKDGTIKVWDADTGITLVNLILDEKNGRGWSVCFSPDGQQILSCSDSRIIRMWNADSGEYIDALKGHGKSICSVSFSPDGNQVAAGAIDGVLEIWDAATLANIFLIPGKLGAIYTLAYSPDSDKLVYAGAGVNIYILDMQNYKLLHELEGHTSSVISCVFSHDGQLLISKSSNEIRIWRTDTWQVVAIIDESSGRSWVPEMAFHPTKPILAAHGDGDSVIKLWELDYQQLLGKPAIEDSAPYTTAKIVLVGDSGVGKTGLGWRLAHNEYKEHSSTHGQQFWVIDELGKKRDDGTECEAVLWDLAGQQDYRLVHALFLENVDLALVLFDPGNHETPLSGVGYWLKQQRWTPSVGHGS